MIDLQNKISGFLRYSQENNLEIYNEFSLQHELGIYLRNELPGYKVQFERNIKDFYPNATRTTKHEIDIVIFKEDKSEKYAIELKLPRNGQYPEEMYAFIKDIVFMEEAKKLGFDATCVLTLVDDKNFYSGSYIAGIYGLFRAGKTICGTVEKPTGHSNETVTVEGHYNVRWNALDDGCRYYYLDIE